MKKLFFNPIQRRLRAGWRVFIYVLSFFLLAALSGFIIKNVLPHRILRSATTLFVIAALAVITLWLAGRFLDHRKFKDYGFHLSKGWWLDFLFGFLLGAFLISSIFLFEKAMGWITIVDFFQNKKEGFSGLPFIVPFLTGCIAYILVGYYEEVVFRANPIKNLAEGFNRKNAVAKKALMGAYVLSSLIFGLAHSGNPHITFLAVINLILGGLFLGLPYVLSGELSISIALHISWNFSQELIFGFPASGVFGKTCVIAIEQGGPAIWTGGAFGPEGGLIGSVAILAGCTLVLLWFKMTKRRLSLASRLAEYRSP